MVKAAKKDSNAAPLQLDDLKDKTCVESGREEWKDEISGLLFSKKYDSLTKKQKQKVGGHRLALNRKLAAEQEK